MTNTPGAPQPLALEFRGTAGEYFRIWVVNLCLSLLTLGIFSAWAKVRKKRYYYSHTTLDGTPFQYLGQPLPILKGRAIAVAMFLIYYITSNFFLSIQPYLLVIGTVLAPWVVVRSSAFNARYSAFRNMRFSFHGDYLSAARTLYLGGLIPLIVVGTIFDWWGYWKLAAAVYGLFGLIFPWWIRGLKHFIVTGTCYGDRNGELNVTGGQFMRMYFRAGLILFASGVIVGLSGFAMMSLAGHPEWIAALVIPFYAGYVLSYAYTQAHGSNLVWNHARLGPLRFESTLRGRELARLYVTNALAILMSLGLMTPWAVMRTLKYRADHMRVIADESLRAFAGDSATAVHAAGAEIGEFFDVDLSL